VEVLFVEVAVVPTCAAVGALGDALAGAPLNGLAIKIRPEATASPTRRITE